MPEVLLILTFLGGLLLVLNELILLRGDIFLRVGRYLEILQRTGSDLGEDWACDRAAMPFWLGVDKRDKQHEFRRVRRDKTDE